MALGTSQKIYPIQLQSDILFSHPSIHFLTSCLWCRGGEGVHIDFFLFTSSEKESTPKEKKNTQFFPFRVDLFRKQLGVQEAAKLVSLVENGKKSTVYPALTLQ